MNKNKLFIESIINGIEAQGKYHGFNEATYGNAFLFKSFEEHDEFMKLLQAIKYEEVFYFSFTYHFDIRFFDDRDLVIKQLKEISNKL